MAIIMIRTLIVYSVLLLTMRLLGKRQLGEMELPEFLFASLVADLAANPLQDLGVPMLNGLVPVVVLFCCELVISGATARSIRLRALLFDKPSLLIVRGKINQRELRRSCYTVDELLQEMRNQGYMDISQVEYAVLEIDGSLNVFPFAEHMPATAGQLGIPADSGGYPVVLINDGRVLDHNLRLMGRDRAWLDKELKRRNVSSPSAVFLLMLNRADQIYFAPKEERHET